MELLNQATIKIMALSAVGTYGVLEAIKPMIKRFSPDSWQRLCVRLGSLVLGAGWGFSLDMSANGAIAGVCGAALSSTIVAAVKRVMRARAS